MEYVYRLIDPRDGIPFYVGITDRPGRRLQQHCYNGSTNNFEKHTRIQKMKDEGVFPRMQIIEILPLREVAEESEKFWISEYIAQGCPLTNVNYNEKAKSSSSTEEGPSSPHFVYPTHVIRAFTRYRNQCKKQKAS